MIRKIIEILQTHDKDAEPYDLETKAKAATIGVQIEDCLNSKFQDLKAYSDKARSIIFNLKDPKNPKLKIDILKEDITPWDLVTLGPKELASESLKNMRQKTQDENL